MTTYVRYSADSAIDEFFNSNTTATRQQCDEFAVSHAGGVSIALQMQGVCSYTVTAGPNNSKLFQFQDKNSILNISNLDRVKAIYPEFVASCRYLGTMGDSRPVFIYEMEYLPGTAHIMARIPPDDTFRQDNTIKVFARFFAQSRNNDLRPCLDASATLLMEFQSNFDLLARDLPSRSALNLERVRKELLSIFSKALPLVLSHGDLNVMNILNLGVFGDSAQKTGVASDVWRYYLISHRPETGDTEFNWDSFVSANNNILLKNLGNFVSRVVKFVNSTKFNNIVPDYTRYHEKSFDTWKEDVNGLLGEYLEKLEAVKIRGALAVVLSISQQGNAFLQSNGLDNKLAANEPLKCAAVIGLALNLIHLLASIVSPLMPDTADKMNAQLRAEPLQIPDHWNADSIKPGHEISKATFLFSNLKPEKAQQWRGLFGGQEAHKVKAEEAARKAARKAVKGAKTTHKE